MEDKILTTVSFEENSETPYGDVYPHFHVSLMKSSLIAKDWKCSYTPKNESGTFKSEREDFSLLEKIYNREKVHRIVFSNHRNDSDDSDSVDQADIKSIDDIVRIISFNSSSDIVTPIIKARLYFDYNEDKKWALVKELSDDMSDADVVTINSYDEFKRAFVKYSSRYPFVTLFESEQSCDSYTWGQTRLNFSCIEEGISYDTLKHRIYDNNISDVIEIQQIKEDLYINIILTELLSTTTDLRINYTWDYDSDSNATIVLHVDRSENDVYFNILHLWILNHLFSPYSDIRYFEFWEDDKCIGKISRKFTRTNYLETMREKISRHKRFVCIKNLCPLKIDDRTYAHMNVAQLSRKNNEFALLDINFISLCLSNAGRRAIPCTYHNCAEMFTCYGIDDRYTVMLPDILRVLSQAYSVIVDAAIYENNRWIPKYKYPNFRFVTGVDQREFVRLHRDEYSNNSYRFFSDYYADENNNPKTFL